MCAIVTLRAGDDWGALISYLILGEQGNDVAQVNAAWLLRQGLTYTVRA
jgi:hypothetical protein